MGEQRDESRAEAGRRKTDRRQNDRRAGVRIAYPIGAAPKILNIKSQVVGITPNAIRFFIADFNPQKSELKEGDRVKLSIKFRDSKVVKMNGTISRREKHYEDREFFVCLLDEGFPQERLDKEQAYLLKYFPDFCKDSFS
ncbi:MAG: hypothetical protein JW806_07180 [Sedimentisphaerales bacterium]|nr:hypothetical protein [Sedimentisphaerales bacterium]